MTTRFTELDLSNQTLIARFVADTFLKDINRRVNVDEIIRLFNAYDVDIDWTGPDSFEIRSNEKLEQAVKHLMAGY